MDIVFTSCDLRVRKKISGVKRVRRLGGRKKRRSISRGGERGSRVLGFSNQDLCRAGWKFCHTNTSTLDYRDESGMNSGRSDGIVLHCLYIFDIISFPFNCIDIALSVANAMIGAKVVEIIFFGPFLISETVLKFLIRTQGEIGPGNLASAVNRVCVKKP